MVNDNNSTPSSRNETPVPQELFTTPGTVGCSVGTSSRGPGPGARKTKAIAAEEDFKHKKIKLNQDLVSAVKERQRTYSKFVSIRELSTTFRDAALGYKTFKDSDPEEAQKYKEIMTPTLRKGTNVEHSARFRSPKIDTSDSLTIASISYFFS